MTKEYMLLKPFMGLEAGEKIVITKLPEPSEFSVAMTIRLISEKQLMDEGVIEDEGEPNQEQEYFAEAADMEEAIIKLEANRLKKLNDILDHIHVKLSSWGAPDEATKINSLITYASNKKLSAADMYEFFKKILINYPFVEQQVKKEVDEIHEMFALPQ